MKLYIRLISIPRMLLVAVASLGAIAVPASRAALQTLPGVFISINDNSRMLSADGNVAILAASEADGISTRWTASAGAVKLPLPAGGGSWGAYCHLNEDGSELAGQGKQSFNLQPWLWRKGHGTALYPSSGYEKYIGITADGDCTERLSQTATTAKVFQDFATSGTTVVWAEGPAGIFFGTSEDGRVLFGRTRSSDFLPCYWDFSGQRVVAANFIGNHAECAMSNHDGTVFLGRIHTGTYFPGNGAPEINETFRWNALTGQIEYFFPPHFLNAEPAFISPDGNILCIWGYYDDTSHTRTMVYDSTTAADAALGMQDGGQWLVNHSYIGSTELQNRTSFVIRAMSKDQTKVAGNYTDSAGVVHGFIAQKPIFGTPPPIGTK